MPKLSQGLCSPESVWSRVTVPGWYGEGEREVDLASDTAVCYQTGLPPGPIRWVLVGDPWGRFKPQALQCTELNLAPPQVLAWFVLRWQLEVTFQEVGAHFYMSPTQVETVKVPRSLLERLTERLAYAA